MVLSILIREDVGCDCGAALPLRNGCCTPAPLGGRGIEFGMPGNAGGGAAETGARPV